MEKSLSPWCGRSPVVSVSRSRNECVARWVRTASKSALVTTFISLPFCDEVLLDEVVDVLRDTPVSLSSTHLCVVREQYRYPHHDLNARAFIFSALAVQPIRILEWSRHRRRLFFSLHSRRHCKQLPYRKALSRL